MQTFSADADLGLDDLVGRVINANCFDVFRHIPDGSVDVILADLPYGKTKNPWDKQLDLERLWPQYLRVLKPNGAVVLNAQEPYTSILVVSQLKLFKYKWLWEKNVPNGHLNAKKQPMRWTEDIPVFYRKQPTYNAQMRTGKGYKVRTLNKSSNHGAQRLVEAVNDGTGYYPKDILRFDSHNGGGKRHPTQKPVGLCEYLIRTYTNPGELVLDNTAGGFTTAIAARNTDRRIIAVERKLSYCQVGRQALELPDSSLIVVGTDTWE